MIPSLVAAVRCVALAALATLLAAWLDRRIESAPVRWRRWFRIALPLPFLAPTLVTGYGWSAFSPVTIRSAAALETLYFVLLLARLMPVAALVLRGAPPAPVSTSAWHAWRLRFGSFAIGQRGADVPRDRWLRLRVGLPLFLGGPAWRVAPAFAVVFLLAFQDFELAALLRTGFGQAQAPITWTVPLFDLQAGGWPLSDSLARGVAPLLIESVVAIPLGLLWFGFRGGREAEISPTRGTASCSPLALAGVAAWLAVAVLLTLAIPFGAIAHNGLAAVGSSLVEPRFLRELLNTLICAVLGGASTFWLARRLVRPPAPGSTASLLTGASGAVAVSRVALLVPGLAGSLLLGLTSMALFQTRPFAFVYDTPVPLALGLTLFLLPRAALLLLLRDLLEPSEAIHAARLAECAPDSERRRRAGAVWWALKGRHDFEAVAILVWIAWWELTLPSLLAPVSMPLVTTSLYNQMHFGRSGVLCGRVVVTTAAPCLALLLGAAIVRRRAGAARS